MIFLQLYDYDEQQRQRFGCFCGIDEAGRGPLAGPVCVAGVILKPESRFDWLNDSKKVTARRRDLLYDQIVASCAAYHIELIDNHIIDERNILGATLLGMRRCADALAEQGAALALVDGNRPPAGAAVPCVAVVKGDAASASIAAASVLAKVTRDRFMMELDVQYPQYGFAQHKGYPTKAHYAAIEQFGLTPHHRLSFLKGREYR